MYYLMPRFRTKFWFKCSEHKDLLCRCQNDKIKNCVFICGKFLKEIKNLFEDTYQYGGIWKSKKINNFYSLQQFSASLQHPSLQQLLLHSPVLHPSLQQPLAQQVSLQQIFTSSTSSVIIALLFYTNIFYNCNKYTFNVII